MAKEKPILFRGDLVRKILAGEKTQTRRPVKFPKDGPDWNGPDCPELSFVPLKGFPGIFTFWEEEYPEEGGINIACPYGQPGDLLWVRETWGVPHGRSSAPSDLRDVVYRADGDREFREYGYRWRPSIHMPKWAARIWLEITGVRAERVQEITEESAIAEGVLPAETTDGDELFRLGFMDAWDRTYHGSWDRNDWVWVIEFKKIYFSPISSKVGGGRDKSTVLPTPATV